MIVTLVVIGLTTLVSLLAFNNPRVRQQLILWPPAVRATGGRMPSRS